MSTREDVLTRTRSRLGREGTVGEPIRIDRDTGTPPRPVVTEDLVAHFTAKAETIAATTEVVDSPVKVPQAINLYLTSKGLPPEVTTGDDTWLSRFPWQEAGIAVTIGKPSASALVGVSHAAFAVAETGTLVMASGPDNPATISFLPDYNIVVVERSRVVAYQEEVWPLFREQGMPRSLCFVTGPSRTGDIEFDLQLGPHGPRNLHVIIVAEDCD
jgi:L-lactate dehydrogenase complex protein LldG